MRWLGGVLGAVLLATVLWDAFETIILPRRVSGRIRLTRLFYARRGSRGGHSSSFVSAVGVTYPLDFGPLSLILLLALWAVGSVLSFGLLQWPPARQ